MFRHALHAVGAVARGRGEEDMRWSCARSARSAEVGSAVSLAVVWTPWLAYLTGKHAYKGSRTRRETESDLAAWCPATAPWRWT